MPAEKQFTVWFLSSWYPTRVHDTLGNFVARHAEAVATSCQVHVLHVCSHDQANLSSEPCHTWRNGVHEHIVYLKRKSSLPGLSKLLHYLRIRRAYLQLSRELISQGQQPDLIHANVFYPVTLYARLLSKRYRIPFVVTEHWTGFLPEDPVKPKTGVLSVIRRSAAAAACIMPVSEHLARAMQQAGINGHYRVVTNVVDTELFVPAQAKSPDPKKKLLHVSTLHDRQKNFSGLLKALSILLKRRQDFMLEVISDGDFQPYLAEISTLGLTGHVTFRGKLDASGVAAATASAQLLLLFSRYENFPCVIPEALSCGVPVLSTDVGGISEHLGSGEYGMLVPSEDTEGFAAAIDQILSNPERFAPGKLRAYALEHFSKAAVAQAFTGVYHEITASRV